MKAIHNIIATPTARQAAVNDITKIQKMKAIHNIVYATCSAASAVNDITKYHIYHVCHAYNTGDSMTPNVKPDGLTGQ